MYFVNGTCNKGDNCIFRHNLLARAGSHDVCPNWIRYHSCDDQLCKKLHPKQTLKASLEEIEEFEVFFLTHSFLSFLFLLLPLLLPLPLPPLFRLYIYVLSFPLLFIYLFMFLITQTAKAKQDANAAQEAILNYNFHVHTIVRRVYCPRSATLAYGGETT